MGHPVLHIVPTYSLYLQTETVLCLWYDGLGRLCQGWVVVILTSDIFRPFITVISTLNTRYDASMAAAPWPV